MIRCTLLAICLGLPFCAGCAQLVSSTAARVMVRAPNQVDPRIRLTNLRPIRRNSDGFADRFWVQVGPPEARLLVSIVDSPAGTHPIGTLLVLHGAYGRSEDMLNIASALTSYGYRVVLVDLRGHGRSTGGRITYGIQESEDLAQVVDVLQQRNLIAGRLGVYGFSYGATTAIALAGRDPRVSAVVAVAPFSSLREAVGHVMRTRVPTARRFADEQWVAQTLQQAAREGGFNPDAADAKAAMQVTSARVLMIHGDADRLVTPDHSVRLHRSAIDRSYVLFIPGATHSDLSRDSSGSVSSLAATWFQRWMSAQPPPASPSYSVRRP